MSLWNDEQPRPLGHLRVIDSTIMLTGPYVTRMLAQYGADVVKIEGLPEGDPLRNLKNTSLFELLNQGKKSLALNLKTPTGIEAIRRLVAESDVYVENFREGVMDRLGLGYPELSEINPDLLYVSLRGMSGKNASHSGHDLNFVATSGCGDWFLESGVPNYSTFFGDVVGGALVPVIKILAHLANPQRKGMHLHCYMDEGFRALYVTRAFDAYKAQSLPPGEREKYGASVIFSGNFPHSKYYRCRDNTWVALQAIQKKHWDIFCEVIDHQQWKDRFEDVTLVPELERLFSDAPSSYWAALASSREICLFRVIPFQEHLENTQAKAQLSTDPFTWMGLQPNNSLLPTPTLGKDTFTVLHNIGFGNKEIASGIQTGTFGSSEKLP